MEGEELKYLEDLRGKHTGEEIWVIGAGPSLDDYPLNFFEDKICVGVNWVFSVFVDIGDGLEKFSTKTFYSVHSHAEHAYWIRDHIPHFLKRCFFISRPLSHKMYKGKPYCCPDDFNKDPYWIRNSYEVNDVRASGAGFERMAKCIMAGRDDCRYLCRGTSLHWAIDVAAVLGAKKIYLVGADVFGPYMRKHGSLYLKPRKKKPHLRRPWIGGTKCLAQVFKPYGIEIVYYNYGKGERIP